MIVGLMSKLFNNMDKKSSIQENKQTKDVKKNKSKGIMLIQITEDKKKFIYLVTAW